MKRIKLYEDFCLEVYDFIIKRVHQLTAKSGWITYEDKLDIASDVYLSMAKKLIREIYDEDKPYKTFTSLKCLHGISKHCKRNKRPQVNLEDVTLVYHEVEFLRLELEDQAIEEAPTDRERRLRLKGR